MHSKGHVHGLFRVERVVAILLVGPSGVHFRPQSDCWPLAVVVATEAGSLKGLFGENHHNQAIPSPISIGNSTSSGLHD